MSISPCLSIAPFVFMYGTQFLQLNMIKNYVFIYIPLLRFAFFIACAVAVRCGPDSLFCHCQFISGSLSLVSFRSIEIRSKWCLSLWRKKTWGLRGECTEVISKLYCCFRSSSYPFDILTLFLILIVAICLRSSYAMYCRDFLPCLFVFREPTYFGPEACLCSSLCWKLLSAWKFFVT